MTRTNLLCLAALAAIAGAGAAHAAPRLLSSVPDEKSLVAPTQRIELRFSEPVSARLSSGDLTMTTMVMNGRLENMDMPMGHLATSVEPAHPNTLVLTSRSLLAVGTYNLKWRVAGGAGPLTQGTLIFNVKGAGTHAGPPHHHPAVAPGTGS